MEKEVKIFDELLRNASKIFKKEKTKFECFFSPGRINIIGEHIDYNGGCVLPCALDFGTYAVASKNTDEVVRCYSENFEEDGVIEFAIDEFRKSPKGSWVNFVKGMLTEMVEDGYTFLNGFDIYVKGTIPNGAGLSSSASLELLLGVVLRDFYFLDYTNVELALLGQRCEHHYIGVNCGIMDQFIIAMGEDKKAVQLNTATLDYKYVNCEMDNYVIVIGNTNYRRTLDESKYNERRSECDKSLSLIQKHKQIKSLCDLNVSDLSEIENILNDEILYKRVKHVVSENDRVVKAINALNNKDYKLLGSLLNESHNSLRDNYEVTGLALDSLVDSFRKEDILGSRMTGAGFGGCMIALVDKNKLDGMLERVNESYYNLTGLKADFYIARVGSKARKVCL